MGVQKKVVVLVLVSFFLLAGMAAGPARGAELKLILADYLPPSYEDYFPPVQMFVDYVNKNGKGKVQIDFFHSGKLLQAEQLIPGLMQGTADFVVHTDSYVTGTAPIFGILELPFLYKDVFDYSRRVRIGTPLYNLINQELAKQNMTALSFCASPPEHIWTVDKPVRVAADLKGMRIRTAGWVETEVVKALGAASTTLSSAELYDALKKKTVDAALCYAGTVPSRSLQEVLKYVNLGYFGSYCREIFMRQDKYQALPQDVKDILMGGGKVYEEDGFKSLIKVHNEKYWPLMRKAGLKEITPTAEENKKFKEALLPVWDWWKTKVPPDVAARAMELATK